MSYIKSVSFSARHSEENTTGEKPKKAATSTSHDENSIKVKLANVLRGTSNEAAPKKSSGYSTQPPSESTSTPIPAKQSYPCGDGEGGI